MTITTYMITINHNHQVDMLDPVTANFLGDNLRCWMQIQVRTLPPNLPNTIKYKYKPVTLDAKCKYRSLSTQVDQTSDSSAPNSRLARGRTRAR